MLGAWLCAPIPFLTELYKGLLKKEKKSKVLSKKGRTLETIQNTENILFLLQGWREKVEVARCLYGKQTRPSFLLRDF